MPLRAAPCYHAGMPRKPKRQPDDPEQSKRFIDMAREVGAEQPSPDFERVFRKVAEQSKGVPPNRLRKKSVGGVPRPIRRPLRLRNGFFTASSEA